MEKINIAELLKDCPKGMELNCAIYEDVHFDYVDESQIIHCYIQKKLCKTGIFFNKHGAINSDTKSKCVIFPKGRTTWGDFIPHYKFKDGDVLTYMFCNKPTIYIYRENGGYNTSYYAAYSTENKRFYYIQTGALAGNRNDLRFASKEEQQRLFDVIKENGYKWNPITKTLEKLIVPKFKVGDKIRNVIVNLGTYTVLNIGISGYAVEKDDKHGNFRINFDDEKYWELTPNKFDITTLKPFDKVLVRQCNTQYWKPAFWGRYSTNSDFPFITSFGVTAQAIPFKNNEWLVGTTEDCNDYYKTWK